ncbi:MAG TPA: hypothetical protein DFR83_14135, partial [Deltaproteobacteria bacterium]|nr:hypothetical protein [Deltaproteobacteria bacterium]
MINNAARLPRLWSRWVQVLDHREPAHGLALFRFFMGLTLLVDLMDLLRHDLITLLWMSVEDGGYRTYGRTGSWLVNALGGPTPELIWGFWGLCLLASLALILGVLPRVAALIGLQTFLALAWVNHHTGGSYDMLITNMLWLLVLADSSATGSLTARWHTGRFWPDTPVPAWPRYLVVGQMVTVYLSTGLQKVSASWVPGGDLSALYYILQQPSWQRFDLSFAAHVYPLTQLGTLATWLFEVGSPVLILAFWYRATSERPGRLRALFNRFDVRTLWLATGVLLHTGIMVTLDVGP